MYLKGAEVRDIEEFEQVWSATHQYAKSKKYKDYNKHDGLNSPILKALFGWHKWARIIAIQTVMRFPFNIRPLLLTEKVYNPKGLSLLARSLFLGYQRSGDVNYLQEAEELISILGDLRVKGFSGSAWGYNYPWQDPGFYAASGVPNAVVTAFVCQAYLLAFRVTKKSSYLEVVRQAIDFFLKDLTVLKDEGNELCLSYMPLPMEMRVMDVSILIGSVISQYNQMSGDPRLQKVAHRLVNYVVNRQADTGAWFYTDPPSQSHIVHDNYHTGFILDALWEYMQATGDFTFMSKYQAGLKFYARELFMPDGAPRWMSHIEYPYDIHGAAQGIITFSRHRKEYPGLADKVATWTMNNLYSGKGYFYYQRCRFYTKRFTLMRWCNAWMCMALSSFLAPTQDCSG